jgi:hypothetical protein
MIKKKILKTAVETGSIVFLFYANLLMGEYIRSGPGQQHGFLWALINIFTWANFLIAIIAALFGYVIFQFLRKKY